MVMQAKRASAIGALAGIISLGLTTLAGAGTVDWVQTYSDAGHTGLNSRETKLSPSNVPALIPGWSASLKGVSVRAFVLNDLRVIVRTTHPYGQSFDLYSLDAATGAQRWKTNTGREFGATNNTIATGDNLIFSECGQVDAYGYDYSGVCAYKKSNGKRIWVFKNPCDCSPEARLVTPLTYDNHLVFFGYFNGGALGKAYVLVADAVTGHILGAYQTGDMNSLGSAPVIHSLQTQHMYFDCGGSVCAVSTPDGALSWKTPMGAPVGALSTDGTRVYANLCNGSAGLVALDAATGASLWSYGAPECNKAPAALNATNVYFNGADQKVHALNAQTGSELWSSAAGAASSPSLANGVMYVGGAPEAPAMSAYDWSTGTLLWSNLPYGSSAYLPPVIVDGSLYVANESCGAVCSYVLPAGMRK
ncbi:MAG: PQQ-binding-like beta-propeller repeat protein [Alphaproteobacteria bacterium]|nr:PQQ-binding-like beta-propeller repeat protein [Alphaproteobacteria bacterium]MBV9063760.1 PQQ-binding-like beta-propeller repeat protein [Alphaproteobacteria bacterium]